MRRLWWRFLGQGSGKIQVQARERCIRDLLREHLDRVMHDQAQVPHAGLMRLQQAMADARLVDLDTDKVKIRVRLRQFHQRLTVAESDLENERRLAAEDRRRIEWRIAELESESRPQLGQRTFLRRRQAARAAYETPDGSLVFRIFRHGRHQDAQLDSVQRKKNARRTGTGG